MQFRAFILLTCLFVVPGLAMFSHHMPSEVRARLRHYIWNPAHQAASAITRALALGTETAPPAESPFVAAAAPTASPAAPASPPAGEPAPDPNDGGLASATPARVVMPTVTVAPATATTAPVPPQGNGLTVPVATARAAERSFTQAPRRTPPAPGSGAPAGPAPEPSAEPLALPPRRQPDTPPPAPAPPLTQVDRGPDLAAIQQRLAELGAFGIECQPLAGGGAGYASVCRMRIDPRGELQRMFHGSGPDAASAMQSLVEQIEAWTRKPSTAARL